MFLSLHQIFLMNIVRSATEADIFMMVQLAELSHREYSRMSSEFHIPVEAPFWEDRLRKSFKLQNYYALVCCPVDDSSSILGYCEFFIVETQVPYLKHRLRGVIDNIVVQQAVRKQGIATSLIEVAEQYVRMKGATMIELSVLATNRNAINLYANLGYKAQNVVMSRVF